MTLPIPLTVQLSARRTVKHIERELRSLRFRSVAPGGFASAQFSLDRPLASSPDELAYYTDVDIYDARNGECVWCGRLEDPGRGVGSDGQVWDLAAVGPSAHALDRTSPLIYLDTSLENWKLFSTSIRSARWATEEDANKNSFLRGTFQEGITIATSDDLTLLYTLVQEAGMVLGRVRSAITTGVTTTGYEGRLLTTQGAGSTIVHQLTWSTSTQVLDGSAGGTNAIPSGDHTAFLRLIRTGASETVTNTRWGNLQAIAVQGRRKNADGTDITSGYGTPGSAWTITATQVVNDLLGRLLTEYDGDEAEVATTSYAIDQLAYPDGVTPAQVLNDLMQLEPAYFWRATTRNSSGKYHFEWLTWPTTVRYEADAVDGYSSTGSASELYNAVIVRWKDAGGHARRTRRTQTVAELDNAGLTREGFLDLGDEVASSANATQAGDQFLAAHAAPLNAGTLTVARPIYDHDRGRMVQPWEIQPGNLIRVRGVQPSPDSLNATGRDGVTVFSIVGVDYDTGSAAATVELDSYSPTVARALAALPPRVSAAMPSLYTRRARRR